MNTFCTNIKSSLLTLFIVFLLVGCIPTQITVTKHKTWEAQVDTDQESVHLAAKEGVEITNGRFKLFVYFDNPSFKMRLFVPEGEELFVIEPFVEFIETTTQQELEKLEVNWDHLDPQLDNYPGRLIGVMSEPPATVYAASVFFSYGYGKPDGEEIDLRFPVFKTKGNETIIFDNVTFRFTTHEETNITDAIMIPLVF